jgi:hypothetical protein
VQIDIDLMSRLKRVKKLIWEALKYRLLVYETCALMDLLMAL